MDYRFPWILILFSKQKKISLSTQLKNDAHFHSSSIGDQYKLALCSPILSENIEKHLTLTEFIKTIPF